MIDITLIYKKKVGPSDDFSIEEIEKGLISIKKPKTYEELEKEIRNKFKLENKEITIKAIIDSEDINIKDEDTYTDEDNQNAKRFKVCLDEDTSEASTDIDINIDELLDIKDNLIIDENEFKTILDTQINSQLNKEELKMDEIEEEKVDDNKSLEEFMTDIKEKIKTATENHKQTFMDSIKNELKPFDELIEKKIKSIQSDIDNNLKETKQVTSMIKGMKGAIQKLASNSSIIHKTTNDNDALEKEKKEKEDRERKEKEEREQKERKEREEKEEKERKEKEEKERKEKEEREQKERKEKEEKEEKERKEKEERERKEKEKEIEVKKDEDKEKEVKKDEDKEKEVKKEKSVKPGEMTDEEVEKIYSNFDEQYGLDGILDEEKKEELLNKIRELKGNLEELADYIEDKYI